MRKKLRVNLLIHAHTVGLRTDARVWRRALRECGVEASITAFTPLLPVRAFRALRKGAFRIASTPRYDINIFAEDIVEGWCRFARVNVFVPHQEWVTDRVRKKLGAVEWMFCKSRFAEGLFANQGFKTRYIGFSSPDRLDPAIPKDYNRFLHVAGSSHQKGTSAVNEVWLRHPEWPSLTILSQNPVAGVVPAANITTRIGVLRNLPLRRIQNSCGVHLCPSEAEGFGHYLVEAMSMASYVVTTDAPPMNELVRPDRGILVGYHHTSPGGMGTNYYVDHVALEKAIEGILGMDERSRRSAGEKAREWFLENDRAFVDRLRTAIMEAGGG